MPRPLGTELTMNRNTGSGFGTPAWTHVRGIQDVKLNIQPAAMVKSSDRSVNVDTEVPTRYKVEVDATAFWNGGTGLTALRTAFLNGTPIELAVLYGPAATAKKGVRAEWAVTQFPIDFPLGDNQKIAIKLQPHADYTNSPLFYTDATTTSGTAEMISTKKIGADAAVCASGGTPIGAAMDIKLGLQPGALIDSSDRDSLFDVVKPTRFKFEPEFSFLWNPANAQLMSLYTAATTNGPIELFILDGPFDQVEAWGVHSDWAINGFPIDAKLKDGQQVTIKLTPHGDGTIAPAFYTVT